MSPIVALVSLIGLLCGLAIGGTARAVARDGYRAIPTDPLRVPDRHTETEDWSP